MPALSVQAAHDSSSVVFPKNGLKRKQSEMDVSLAADAGHGHGEVCRLKLFTAPESPENTFADDLYAVLVGVGQDEETLAQAHRIQVR